jgi:hypothetical protein
MTPGCKGRALFGLPPGHKTAEPQMPAAGPASELAPGRAVACGRHRGPAFVDLVSKSRLRPARAAPLQRAVRRAPAR